LAFRSHDAQLGQYCPLRGSRHTMGVTLGMRRCAPYLWNFYNSLPFIDRGPSPDLIAILIAVLYGLWAGLSVGGHIGNETTAWVAIAWEDGRAVCKLGYLCSMRRHLEACLVALKPRRNQAQRMRCNGRGDSFEESRCVWVYVCLCVMCVCIRILLGWVHDT